MFAWFEYLVVLVGGLEPQQQPQPMASTTHKLWDNTFRVLYLDRQTLKKASSSNFRIPSLPRPTEIFYLRMHLQETSANQQHNHHQTFQVPKMEVLTYISCM